jgi:hypothetical protein
MTTLLAPIEALEESQRLIATLEQLRNEIPFAEDILAVHRPTHTELEQTHIRTEQAVAAWRAALAQRWECEVAGRRLYKRLLRQLSAHYGGDHAPEIQLLSRGGAEANSSPAELLADLRRLQAALSVGSAAQLFAGEPSNELEQACTALEDAVAVANTAETQRRNAVLDNRLANEAYRRARTETRRRLVEHYGEQLASTFGELLD